MTDYRTEIRELRLQDRSLRFRSFADFDKEVSQAIERGGQDEDAPLFGDLWPAGRALCQLLCGLDLAGHSLLEMGCGLGLASIVAAQQGARVTASDYHGDCRRFVLENAALNQVTLGYNPLDWRQERSALPAQDLIVASDVLYEPKSYIHLARCIKLHSKPSTRLIIADPDRIYSDRFAEVIHSTGFHLEKSQKSDGVSIKEWVLKDGISSGI